MEPRIQYAKTEDGVSIAYWTLGEGTPFVQTPSSPVNPAQFSWENPEGRRWYEQLAETRMLVRYDNRGFGNSQHDVTEFSLEALLMDLEGVVDRLGLETFALFGYFHSGPVAIAYAARHPERVSHLVLWCTSASGAEFYQSSRNQALRELADKDWELYTETMAHAVLGWSAGERAREYAAYLRDNVTPEALRGVTEALMQMDMTDFLPQLTVPTLVLHRPELHAPAVDRVRDLAARIPDARLALLKGDSVAPYLGDADQVLATIDEFLPEGEPAGTQAPPPSPSGLVTILFTDMESSTALTQRLGDAKAQELVHTHNTIVRDALNAHRGSEIKHTGDGIMASFPTASGALECAIAIQQAVSSYSDEQPDAPLGVHIGLNAGEPIAEEEDLFGTAVQLARRVCDHAEPGQILAPIVVRELAAGKGFLFADRGDVALRGFEDPVRLYEVRWRES